MCNRFDLYYWCEHLSYMNDSFIPWKICSCSPNPKFPYSLYPPNRQIMRIMAWAYGWRMPIFFTFVDCGKKKKIKKTKNLNFGFSWQKQIGPFLHHWNFFPSLAFLWLSTRNKPSHLPSRKIYAKKYSTIPILKKKNPTV